MPETRTYTVWKYEEAPEKLKEKILEKYHNINVDDNYWYECLIDNWKEKLEEKGFLSPEIAFSGFWSQGDGASFTCKTIELSTLMEKLGDDKKYPELYQDALEGYCFSYIKRDRWGNYVHWNTTSFYLNYDGENQIVNGQADKYEIEIQKYIQELNKDIYTELENGYYFLCQEEQIIETLTANDYYFNEKGEIAHG